MTAGITVRLRTARSGLTLVPLFTNPRLATMCSAGFFASSMAEIPSCGGSSFPW